MKGNVFNIQKFSLHDGPGLRTTVFFKGCPLKCRWCANPESQSEKIQISFDDRKCLHCLTCVRLCPEGCIEPADGRIVLDRERCAGCLSCVNGCPGKALKAEGELTDSDEIVRVCMQDIDFYEESGGGVTFSGGECFTQSEFAAELAEKLKEKGLRLAAETTGYVERDVFARLAPMFDLLLFDVKHYDSEKHFAGTGVHNELILENLRYAAETGLDVLPRVPVIPGFNDSLEDAAGIAELIKSIGLEKVQLLPFHQFGERKYELLGREYDFAGLKALRPEELESYRQIFAERGLDCFF